MKSNLITTADKDLFWMYKVQAFSFHGWFSEAKLIKWGNKPHLISDYINKIDSYEVFKNY